MSSAGRPPVRASLYCLDGSLSGRTFRPDADSSAIGTDAGCEVCLPAGPGEDVAACHARLERDGDDFVLEAAGAYPVYVNDVLVGRTRLVQNDVVRLGERGPALRFRMSRGRRVTKTFSEMLVDSTDFARRSSSERPTTHIRAFTRQLVHEAVRHGTRRFRVGFLILLAMLSGTVAGLVVVGVQGQRDRQRLEATLAEERARSAERARESEALNAALSALESDLRRRDADASSLMDALRERAERAEKGLLDLGRDLGSVVRDNAAAQEIHRQYARGVGFIAVGVAFYDPERKQFVRHVVDPATGQRKEDVGGYELKLGAEGDKFLEWSSGSGFVVSRDGLVVSNRHVVDPWWKDDDFGRGIVTAGCRPVRERFLIFFPGRPEPIDLVRVASSTEADVALARLAVPAPEIPVLPLAAEDHEAVVGQKMILLGYPLGLEGLVTKLDSAESRALLASGVDSLESALRSIARIGGVRESMTQGVLSNVTSEALVYDAVTTSGGSGGPLFSSDGYVVAINEAITRFAGANHGVPIAAARKLLEQGPFAARVLDDAELAPEDAREQTDAASARK